MKEPVAEPIGLKSYMLVRVALDVGEDEWFGEKLKFSEISLEADDESFEGGIAEKGEDSFGLGRLFKLPFFGKILTAPGRLKKRIIRGRRKGIFQKKRQRQESLRRESLRAEWEARIRRAVSAIEKLAAEAMEYAGEENNCFSVYEGSIRKVLKGTEDSEAVILSEEDKTERLSEILECLSGIPERLSGIPERLSEISKDQVCVLPMLWQQYFPQKEFNAYSSLFWAEQLMPQAVQPHFVVLGYAACIPDLAWNYAGRMKSLRWIFAEADDTEEVQDFAEDFYLETGLAISIQLLPDKKEFRRLRLMCAVPSNILDFTEEARIMDISGVAEGSVWLDLQSVEEKRRWLQGRGKGIRYISMKEKWKYVQRRCNATVLP